MAWLIECVNFLGLLLLLGAAAVRYWFWRSADTPQRGGVEQNIVRRTMITMTAGLAFLLAASVATLTNLVPAVAQALLAASFAVAFYLGERTDSRALRALAAVLGLGLIAVQTASSHAAAEPGLLPIASNGIHWLVASVWGGGLLHLALHRSSTLFATGDDNFSPAVTITRRYALMTLVAIVILALTGGVLAFIHIHNADALAATTYGAAYKMKVLLVSLMLVTVSVHWLGIAPACRRAASADELHNVLQRFRRLMTFETLLLAGIILATGMLATRSPPGLAPFINPQTWLVGSGSVPLKVELQPVAGRVSKVRLEISAAAADYRFAEGSRAIFSMAMTRGNARAYDTEALPIGPAGFLGETVLAMPGEWQLDIKIEEPERAPLLASHVIAVPGPPLASDMRAYLKLATISYSTSHIITFAVGLLLVVAAAWLIRMSVRQAAPAWMMPIGLINIALGCFLMLSVMFVKTYPSSFWINPQPFEVDNIQQGDSIYREHCAECHGVTGRGDGPWAIENRGSIPDLAAAHMDMHTDGEIYWWIKYGIPSLDMPALGDELSDDENWTVINFMRSLRHGVPRQ